MLTFTASADRRPVDPPPVVELRIFEGEGANRTDITFAYDANFFCYATLSHARQIAHGRVQQGQQQPPVLTGMAVSGMAYLDRPAEAGYFIFPDLSVRHEGKYCLEFNLYEHTKNTKDWSAEDKANEAQILQDNPNGHVWFVNQVKSAPFTVFSAKKFPGLAESTILSRTVAEQGCRVRIRRDVRMRRREGKGGADYDDYDEAYNRARSMTPAETSYPRERSTSNTSVERTAYELHRRPSAYNEPLYASAPQQPQAFLGFGGQSAQQSQFQAPQFVPPPSSAPQYPPYQSSQFRPQQPQSSRYYQERPYAGNQGMRDAYENDYRRQSVNYAAAHYEQEAPRPATNYPTYSPCSEQPVLAPIKVAAVPPPEPKYDTLTSPAVPMSANNHASSSLPSPSYQEHPYNSFAAPTTESRGTKRAFGDSFPSSTYNEPLHNGMRPLSSHGASPGFQDTEDAGIDAFTMQYRRADGSAQNRELPSLS